MTVDLMFQTLPSSLPDYGSLTTIKVGEQYVVFYGDFDLYNGLLLDINVDVTYIPSKYATKDFPGLDMCGDDYGDFFIDTTLFKALGRIYLALIENKHIKESKYLPVALVEKGINEQS